jgi:hypothetical protein
MTGARLALLGALLLAALVLLVVLLVPDSAR